MLIDRWKCLFIHPNKCGGKSIEKALAGIKPTPGSADHRDLMDHRNYTNDSPKVDDYFKFMFCRNPWDRLVSIYFSREQHFGVDHGSFKEFVHWIKPFITPGKQQILYIMDRDWKPNIDFIGRFENYEEDWDKVCKKLGRDMELPHLNKSEHKPYWEYYDDETREIVARKYKDDIEYFNYKFK